MNELWGTEKYLKADFSLHVSLILKLKYGVLFLFKIAKVFLDSFNHFTLEAGRKENLK